MRTFCIQTLGCKVNQYESDQIASVLRAQGLVQVEDANADVRVVNTCSVTSHAAKDSRSWARKFGRVDHGKTILMGCYATSDPDKAREIEGVDAIFTHHENVAERLNALLTQWRTQPPPTEHPLHRKLPSPQPSPAGRGGPSRSSLPPGEGQGEGGQTDQNRPNRLAGFKATNTVIGTTQLPLLHDRQSSHQRAFLKIQDGCDAHCTYCIIPQLRPALWSKSITDAIREAQQLIDAGHHEIVLTGIFLGAYARPTALRRRQPTGAANPLGQLVQALCTSVPGLKRLRLSSLEPGDLTPELIDVLKSHPQVVPHFHLPLQSGSDLILHRMNRQYTRDDFLRMVDLVNDSFDQPALTTDIIVGFPGETDEEFDQTLQVVDHAKFIHIHAFSFSPRQNTAAARWTKDFVRGPVVNDRIAILNARARQYSYDYRDQFIGRTVQVLVERFDESAGDLRHGRCERYFDVHFENATAQPGDLIPLRISRITESRTFGVPLRTPLAVL